MRNSRLHAGRWHQGRLLSLIHVQNFLQTQIQTHSVYFKVSLSLRLLREPSCMYVQREYFESFRIFITVSLC